VVLSHGHPTERVFVLLHGFTNSPRQFRELGERLFATGANVVIPRLPHHGLSDRLTDAHGDLRATDLILYAETGIDIARGLGRRITVVGLSVSGVSAAWVAHARDDVDEVFLLAPFFGPAVVPDLLTPPLAAALVRLPNTFLWWNPKLRENLPGPPTNYPRFATRPLGEVMRLGLATAEATTPVRVRRLGVVLTEGDPAVNNRRTLRIVREWEERSPGVEFFVYTFPRGKRIPHDFIDPLQDGAQVDKVYPLLLAWLTRPPA
jgi:carboxylesterase